MLTDGLHGHIAGEAGDMIELMIERLETLCSELMVESPAAGCMERVIRAAL